MNCMATWEDGPEYAPIERPSDFQNPDAAPLKIAPPYAQMAAWAPKDRPVFDSPGETGRATVDLAADARGAPRPAGTVCRGVQHDDLRLGLGSRALGFADKSARWACRRGWDPVTGCRHPRPEQPLVVGSGNNPPPGNFPAPGTPDWFGPGPYGQQPRPSSPVTARAVLDAATPGLCTCLVIGGLVYFLSPIILCISVSLAGRVKVAKEEIRRVFMLGISVLAAIAVFGMLTVDTGFAEWWRFVGGWGLLMCWSLLGSTLLLVYRRLKSGTPTPPSYQSPGGPR